MTLDTLTPRQREIARLIAEGFTDKVIAAQLGTRVVTVRYHIARIVEAWRLDANRDVRILIACRVCTGARAA